MSVNVRPHTKMMSALLAAGVVAAATPAWVQLAQHAAPAVSVAAVQPASVVTDLLYNVGTVVNGVTKIVEAPIEAALWTPDYAIGTVLIGLRDPALIGSLLSFVAQQYLNPTYGGFADYGVSGLTDITSVLPPPVGAWLTGAVAGTVARIGSLFDGLPDPSAGESAFYDFVNLDFVGNIVDDINWLALAPVYSIAETVSYLGYLPYELEASLESALRNPSEIPGLISNLVWGLIEPYNGLLGRIVDNFVAPLTYLPGIGDLISNVYTAIADGVQNLLDLLPAPVTPTPFPSTAASTSTATALVAALPSSADVVTLDVPKTADQLTTTSDTERKQIAAVDVPPGAAEAVTSTPVADPGVEPDSVTGPLVDTQPQAPAGDVTDGAPGSGTEAAEDAQDSDDAGAKAAEETKPVGAGRHRADTKKDETGSEQKASEQKDSEQKESEQKASEQKASEQKDSEPKAAA
ncbi:predicted protein [Mycolicibacterium canariasense]|uniref:PE-PGRS family protein n=1 Tax=Mycolicibacterium canariasense TaxID=228230 RepID=A0A100WFS4_MYCCR|nr:hypothetical protein [Mycolicibacterium canariasense]MCV7209696.1 hypothetical protein [Mycolicibacterium canariasense]ORU99606.1 hypothetical protein AWB94_01815 [Mycolicibacterium canariasense]GAS97709.1 predicted protein [Mycolicibacterium canariasense]